MELCDKEYDPQCVQEAFALVQSSILCFLQFFILLSIT